MSPKKRSWKESALASSKRKTARKKAVKKRPVGRPRKYTVSQVQKLVDKYFQTCEDSKEPYTITGLALALDTSRKVLCEWVERKDELSPIIQKAKDRVEHYVEKLLLTSRNSNGPIFWLKNFDWTDQRELKVSGDINIANRLAAGRERLAKSRN